MEDNELLLGNILPSSLAGLNKTSLQKKIAEYQTDNSDDVSEEKAKQIARDFESILIGKLMDEVKNTIGNWGFEHDGAAQQVQDIFWMYLARDIADKGGFGLWKDFYESMNVLNNRQTG